MTNVLSDHAKKNILDLSYSRNLQYQTNAIVILSSFVIAVVLALFTNQIDLTNGIQLILLGIFSILFLSYVTVALMKYQWALNDICEQIKQLAI